MTMSEPLPGTVRVRYTGRQPRIFMPDPTNRDQAFLYEHGEELDLPAAEVALWPADGHPYFERVVPSAPAADAALASDERPARTKSPLRLGE